MGSSAYLQQVSPMTPWARSSCAMSGRSRHVMTSSTPSRASMVQSVPNVCAAVASRPCTILRAPARVHVMSADAESQQETQPGLGSST